MRALLLVLLRGFADGLHGVDQDSHRGSGSIDPQLDLLAVSGLNFRYDSPDRYDLVPRLNGVVHGANPSVLSFCRQNREKVYQQKNTQHIQYAKGHQIRIQNATPLIKRPAREDQAGTTYRFLRGLSAPQEIFDDADEDGASHMEYALVHVELGVVVRNVGVLFVIG